LLFHQIIFRFHLYMRSYEGKCRFQWLANNIGRDIYTRAKMQYHTQKSLGRPWTSFQPRFIGLGQVLPLTFFQTHKFVTSTRRWGLEDNCFLWPNGKLPLIATFKNKEIQSPQNSLNQFQICRLKHYSSKKNWWLNLAIVALSFIGIKGGEIIFIIKSIVHHESSKGME